ncbi:hypothetical protein [Mesobacillus jeotgali]|uniref:hypothetical protein n=1 Tax=Mesobacillus jeotgali TaxID=129985 RepID=UPI0009A76AFD|nr:hypothetical protein [Mesobacillus jeotgali]
MIFVAGMGILIIWNLILLFIHFFKEWNHINEMGTRLVSLIILLFMYAKQVVVAGVGVFALALGAAVFSADSVMSWIIALPLAGFFIYTMYHFYPKLIDLEVINKNYGKPDRRRKKKRR